MSSSYLNQEDSINKDWFVDSFPEEDNEEDVDELDDILNEVIPTDDKLDHNLSVIKTDNISSTIKTLLKKLSDKEEIGWGIDADPEEFKHLPNSITGVIIYYVINK